VVVISIGLASPEASAIEGDSNAANVDNTNNIRFMINSFRGIINQSRYNLNRPEDRKSTRLNSSHITISYAVFCLKKKIKKKTKTNIKIELKNKQYHHKTQ